MDYKNNDTGTMPYDPRLLRILRDGACGAAVVHALLAVFFYSSGVELLAILSALGVPVFVALLSLIRGRRIFATVLLAWLQIAGFIAVAGAVLGPDSGCHYYLLVAVPLIFICSPGWKAFNVALAVLLGMEFLLIDQWSYFPSWRAQLEPATLDLARLLNASASFFLTGYLASVYSDFVQRSAHGLTQAANTDHLSGLSNRRHALEVIRQQIVRARQDDTALAFVLIDIDNFKTINDRFGHEAGDAVIAHISNCLKAAVRSHDLVVRWGGEEFLIMLPDTFEQGADRLSRRILAALAADPVAVGSATLHLTATFGISQYRDGDTVESCVRRADVALYHGKRAGKNRVEIWRPEVYAAPAESAATDLPRDEKARGPEAMDATAAVAFEPGKG